MQAAAGVKNMTLGNMDDWASADEWVLPVENVPDVAVPLSTAKTSADSGSAVKKLRVQRKDWAIARARSWKRRKSESGLSLAIVRHCERSDWAWGRSDPMYPFDPTLSEEGRRHADEVGRELANKEVEIPFSIVVVSPFLRCIETGIAICKQTQCPMLIDRGWGEVMSTDLFGEECDLKTLTHPYAESAQLARDAGVQVVNDDDFIGDPPSYPEFLHEGRRRYANLFLTYVDRAWLTRRSFIVVTHSEAFPACLACFPQTTVPAAVPYGGYIFGELVNTAVCHAFDKSQGRKDLVSFLRHLVLRDYTIGTGGSRADWFAPAWVSSPYPWRWALRHVKRISMTDGGRGESDKDEGSRSRQFQDPFRNEAPFSAGRGGAGFANRLPQQDEVTPDLTSQEESCRSGMFRSENFDDPDDGGLSDDTLLFGGSGPAGGDGDSIGSSRSSSNACEFDDHHGPFFTA
jgi:broad specificity phosphatase PhoE